MRTVMTEMRQARKEEVFHEHMSQATSVAESVEEHKPVFLYKPRDKAANQVLVITEEFLDRTVGG